jgi:hypothetical protein
MPSNSKPRRTPQTKADLAISSLSPEDKAELNRLCEAHANASELHRWLSDRVPGVSYRSVLAWYNREYPPGETAKKLNATLATYRGVSPSAAHSASLAHVVAIVDSLMSRLEKSAALYQLDQLSPSLLNSLVDLLREQRQSAQALANSKRLADTKALELAGGYRLVEIATRLAEGSQHAGAISEILKGAIAQLEQEVG